VKQAAVFLVVTNDIFAEGVIDLLASDPRYAVVGWARSGFEALECLPSREVDVLLVDVTLPDASGFELARHVASQASAPLVILLSFHDSRAARLEAWAAGASGFIDKARIADRLLPLVRDLLRQRDVDAQDEESCAQAGTAHETVHLAPES
jgi:DNA-binding NarL/FixJ family response regulator